MTHQLPQLWEIANNCFNPVSCYSSIDIQNFIIDWPGEIYIWGFTELPWVWFGERTNWVHPHNSHPFSKWPILKCNKWLFGKWSILKLVVLATALSIYLYIVQFLKWPITQYDLCSCHIDFFEISTFWKALKTEHRYSVWCRICQILCLNFLLASCKLCCLINSELFFASLESVKPFLEEFL